MRRPGRVRAAAWTLVLVMGASAAPDARRDPAPGDPRPYGVRSPDPHVSALLADGRAKSDRFRRLVDEIGAGDGIVYVVPGKCHVNGIRSCLLHAVTSAPTARYLWIAIEIGDVRPDAIATIAHELQHALEVLQASWIRSGNDIRHFYSSSEGGPPGVRRGHARSYETSAAIEVADIVRSELARDRAAQSSERSTISMGR